MAVQEFFLVEELLLGVASSLQDVLVVGTVLVLGDGDVSAGELLLPCCFLGGLYCLVAYRSCIVSSVSFDETAAGCP